MIQAVELLLQERTPHDVAVALPGQRRYGSPRPTRLGAAAGAPPELPDEASPATLMLSNGRYAVMLTSAGSGFSRWRDLAVTAGARTQRGRLGQLRLPAGRAKRSGLVGGIPADRGRPDNYDVTFSEDRAEYPAGRRPGHATLEIMVSAEDNAEVRRVSIANGGRRAGDRHPYAEIVLATAAADSARLLEDVRRTEYLPEFGAIVATRRRRSPNRRYGPPISPWLKVSRSETSRSNRSRFIGRVHLGDAAAIRDGRHFERPWDGARSRLRAPPPHRDRARQDRARRLLDDPGVVACRTPRPRRQASGAQRVRRGRDLAWARRNCSSAIWA